MLRSAGATRFVIVANPENATLIEEKAGRLGGRVVVQSEARGMADALLSAREAVEESPPEPLYVTQAQDIVDQGLHERLLGQGALEGAHAVIAATRVKTYFPGGYLSLEGD